MVSRTLESEEVEDLVAEGKGVGSVDSIAIADVSLWSNEVTGKEVFLPLGVVAEACGDNVNMDDLVANLLKPLVVGVGWPGITIDGVTGVGMGGRIVDVVTGVGTGGRTACVVTGVGTPGTATDIVSEVNGSGTVMGAVPGVD